MVSQETLKNIQLLQDFSDDHLQHIASLAEIKEFPAGSVVFRKGQLSSSMYLVVQGNITLEFNEPAPGAMQSQTVGSGELLGWTPVLDPGFMTATARVQTPSTLLVLNAVQIRSFWAYDPSFGFAFMQRIAQVLTSKLFATRLLLLDVYREQPPVVAEQGREFNDGTLPTARDFA